MKVFVTGASGFVGRQLCRELIQQGHDVRAAVRSYTNSSYLRQVGCDIVEIASISSETSWDDALGDIDVVIHLAARVHVMEDTASNPLEEFRKINVMGSANLARAAARAKVKRLVYVSSIKVNGEITWGDARFSEFDTPNPQDPYGVSKWEAEQELSEIASKSDLELVIVRPPLVYGEGVKGNFAQMMRVLDKRIPLPFAAIKNRRSLIYVGNLVGALIICACHPLAAGRTYLVSDGEDVSTPELLRELAVGMGLPCRIFKCPEVLLKIAGRITGRTAQIERLVGSLLVDSGKIKSELGWIQPYSVREGLNITGQGFKMGRK